MTLASTPLTALKGVGPALANKLTALHLSNVQDVLFHLPLRYQDRTRVSPISASRLGMELQLEGEVINTEISFGRRRSLYCRIKDASGIIGLRFFHFSAAQKNALSPGTKIRCFGEVRMGKSGLELYHPEYQLLSKAKQAVAGLHLTPIYPLTEGITQGRVRSLAEQALTLLEQDNALVDWIPEPIRQDLGLAELKEALFFLHRPPVGKETFETLYELSEGLHPAQRRLAFEELLSHRLCLRRVREQTVQQSAPSFPAKPELVKQFLKQLGFSLTKAQARAAGEISQDLRRPHPMLRLLQGDVGSGKTVVAAIAALHAIQNGYQAAIMAPTEILAEQHLLNFSQWLEPLGISVTWLSGKVKGRKRSEALALIADGSAQLVVGTHALFQDEVRFAKLGIVIIDEQHRFGVHQRLALRNKGDANGSIPHQLVMTATPIPRTLAMSAYADLDCSIIDELPPGRTAVNTVLVSNERRETVIERIYHACTKGSQAYWVCTLIEESESLQCQAAEATAAELSEQLPNLSIALVHGRMKASEKSAVMNAFKAGEVQLLIATTVIEVGVDVPNASLMVIENPERLGLAQLHQLRGRVGRGSVASHCLLMYQAPLSNIAKQRLSIMRDSNDGFFIAQKDLEIRGPGQVLGTAQTGLMSFRIADIIRDSDLLEKAKAASDRIQAEFPSAVSPLIERWLSDREIYGNV
ncbi:MAG: ATP-dependent DNA helicase RecG [Pseudohongiellaceae bacterium]|nr:ATP-dependent DNA helicase RecG [Pseudohongiellaceae bacterium]